MRRLTIPKTIGLGIGANAMTPERAVWWVVLGPLCTVLVLSMIFGAANVSAAFEAVLHGAAWVVTVWLVILGLA